MSKQVVSVNGEQLANLKSYLHKQIDDLKIGDVELHKDSIILVDYYKLKTSGMHEIAVPESKVFAHGKVVKNG